MAWADLFGRLANGCGVPGGDEDRSALARRLYYDLACDRFDQVVATLVERFEQDDHRDWVHLLDQVTAAPCRWPAIEPTEQTVQRLIPDDQPVTLRAAVSTLVALLWLSRDPHTVPDARWNSRIHDNFLRLAINYSKRLDTTTLEDAAKRFGRG